MGTTREKLKQIPINIWDDYYDDGYVPKGKKQETYAYVEDISALTKTEKQKIMKQLLSYINKNVKLKGVKFSLKYVKNMDRNEVFIQNITHVQREELVKILNKAKLCHQYIPFMFIVNPK